MAKAGLKFKSAFSQLKQTAMEDAWHFVYCSCFYATERWRGIITNETGVEDELQTHLNSAL